MTFRLYESAWVAVDGIAEPQQVHRDAINRAAFNIGSFQYDIDARALDKDAPRILSLLTLQDVREARLSNQYGRDAEPYPDEH